MLSYSSAAQLFKASSWFLYACLSASRNPELLRCHPCWSAIFLATAKVYCLISLFPKLLFFLLTYCYSLVIWSSVAFWGRAPSGLWDSCCRVLRFLPPFCERTLQRGKYAIDLQGWESASVSQLFLNFPRIRLRDDTILSGFQLFSDLCIIFFYPNQSG